MLAGALCACKGGKPAATDSPPSSQPTANVHDATTRISSKVVKAYDTERVASAVTDPPQGAVAVLAARDSLDSKYEGTPPPLGFRFYDGGNKLAAWYMDRAVRLWDVGKRERFARLELASKSFASVAVDSTTGRIYVGTTEPAHLLELSEDGGLLRELSALPADVPTLGHTGELEKVIGDLRIAGGRLVSSAEGYLVVDLKTLSPTLHVGYDDRRQVDDGPVVALCARLSIDGGRLAWQDEGDHGLTIYDVDSAKTTTPELKGPGTTLAAQETCAATPDLTRVALSGAGLVVYDVGNSTPVVRLKDSTIAAVAMSADGGIVAYTHGQDYEKISVLDLPSTKPRKTWAACDRQIDWLAMADDGKLIAADCDGDIVLWPTHRE